jgi:hypothetical protein
MFSRRVIALANSYLNFIRLNKKPTIFNWSRFHPISLLSRVWNFLLQKARCSGKDVFKILFFLESEVTLLSKASHSAPSSNLSGASHIYTLYLVMRAL